MLITWVINVYCSREQLAVYETSANLFSLPSMLLSGDGDDELTHIKMERKKKR